MSAGRNRRFGRGGDCGEHVEIEPPTDHRGAQDHGAICALQTAEPAKNGGAKHIGSRHMPTISCSTA
ncbi:MAG TPA: hypothetical protein VFE16_00905 [Candidatus Cybelea sp.]|nr:hypothetical protein [Candidatus Cybelea sp.]